MKFRKIMSVIASAVMLSSTVAFAAAATYPNPFTDGTAVVYGTNSLPSDMAGAIDIYDQLKERATGTTDASVVGEAKAVETSSQKLYLGDELNTSKTTFLENELPNVLADGTVTDDSGKDYDYVLKVDVPTTDVIYGAGPDSLDDPMFYLDLDGNTKNYTMKITFPTAVNTTKLVDESITLFGKDYTFTGSASDLTSSKIVLFEQATPVNINDGEVVTVEGHTISAAIESSTQASISIDGKSRSVTESNSYNIADVDIYVKNVVGPNVAGTSRYVEIYLNSDKLTLEDTNEVVMGSDDLSGTYVAFTSGTTVSEIAITVIPDNLDDDIEYIALGDSMLDPVFGAIKMELASLSPDIDSSVRDTIVIKPSGEKKASLAFTNKAGKAYNLNILRPSDISINQTYGMFNTTYGPGWFSDNGTSLTTGYGTHTYNATELGVDLTKDLITDTTEYANESDYFITCKNEYTQIWQVTNIKSDYTKVTVKDQGADSDSVTLTFTSNTTDLSLADGSTSTLTLQATVGTGVKTDKGCDYLYTQGGALIDLANADAPNSNLSEITVTEETSYNDGTFTSAVTSSNIGVKNITVRFGYDIVETGSWDMEVRDVFGSTSTGVGTVDTDYWTDDVGDNDNYYMTQYGSFVKQTGDENKQVTITYPEAAMSIGFYIGEVSSEITPGATGVAGGQIAIVQDKDVSTVATKHLIVIGGSCVNTVAAKILDSNTPLCGADFSTATNVGAGGYIIKTVASPENEDKVAMLVAGYNAADTTNAIKRAMVIDGVTTTVGSEEVFPVVA